MPVTDKCLSIGNTAQLLTSGGIKNKHCICLGNDIGIYEGYIGIYNEECHNDDVLSVKTVPWFIA